jgi:hypothetical protein
MSLVTIVLTATTRSDAPKNRPAYALYEHLCESERQSDAIIDNDDFIHPQLHMRPKGRLVWLHSVYTTGATGRLEQCLPTTRRIVLSNACHALANVRIRVTASRPGMTKLGARRTLFQHLLHVGFHSKRSKAHYVIVIAV